MSEEDVKKWMETISNLADVEIAPRLADASEDGVFEDVPHIDDARTFLHDAWESLNGYLKELEHGGAEA
jgi:hypothetical protein